MKSRRIRLWIAIGGMLLLFAVIVLEFKTVPHSDRTHLAASERIPQSQATEGLLDEAPADTTGLRSPLQSSSHPIKGIIRMVDAVTSDALNGSLTCVVIGRDGRSVLPSIQVTNGEWSASIQRPSSVSVTALIINNKPAWPQEAIYTVPEFDPLTVSASYDFDYLVRVVDDATGTPLTDATLAKQTDSIDSPFSPSYAHFGLPGSGEYTAAATFPSPLHYRLCGSGHFLVTAEGYAYEHLWLSSELPSQAIVRLTRAGALIVRIDGDLSSIPSATPWLILRETLNGQPASAECAYSFRLPAGREHVVEKLRPGKYRVAILLAPRNSAQTSLAQADVTVTEANTSQVVLQLPNTLVPQNCMMTGVAYSDEYRDLEGLDSIVIDPVAVTSLVDVETLQVSKSAKTLREDNGTYVWGPLPMAPGKYRIRVKPLNYTAIIAVPDLPFSTIELAIPAKRHISVSVIEEGTGTDIKIDSCFVASAQDESSAREARPTGFSPLSIPNPVELDVYGRAVNLQIDANGFGSRRVILSCDSQVDHVVRLSKVSECEVTAKTFEAPTPVPSSWWAKLKVETLDSSAGEYLGFSVARKEEPIGVMAVRMQVTAPGRYVVRFPAPGNDQALAECEVNFPPSPHVGRGSIDLTRFLYAFQ